MNLPSELILERFRSFASATTLPLSPITLVYGANNSGKSSLLRALALVGEALEADALSPAPLPERVFPNGQFGFLAWQGEAARYDWSVGLRWSEEEVREAKFTLNGSLSGEAYLDQLRLVRGEGEAPWRARVNEDGRLVGQDGAVLPPFVGLMPSLDALPDLHRQLMALRGKVRWLSGVRRGLPRVLGRPQPGGPPRLSDGEDAAEAVAYDSALLAEVAMFYAQLDAPRALEVHEVPPVGRWLSLNPSARATFRVHINDTGEGMAQVLPVLVQASVAAREGSILAIEEPESHLHPSAQGALARHLCALAQRPSAPRFLLETHSRVFLLAVQVAVAGGFPADKVRIVWVDQSPSGRSSAQVITLDQSGRLGDGWPLAALGEDLRLARELALLGRPRVEGR